MKNTVIGKIKNVTEVTKTKNGKEKQSFEIETLRFDSLTGEPIEESRTCYPIVSFKTEINPQEYLNKMVKAVIYLNVYETSNNESGEIYKNLYLSLHSLEIK